MIALLLTTRKANPGQSRWYLKRRMPGDCIFIPNIIFVKLKIQMRKANGLSLGFPDRKKISVKMPMLNSTRGRQEYDNRKRI